MYGPLNGAAILRAALGGSNLGQDLNEPEPEPTAESAQSCGDSAPADDNVEAFKRILEERGYTEDLESKFDRAVDPLQGHGNTHARVADPLLEKIAGMVGVELRTRR